MSCHFKERFRSAVTLVPEELDLLHRLTISQKVLRN
jgi:hypothetical protein